jgi:hypothetical protein
MMKASLAERAPELSSSGSMQPRKDSEWTFEQAKNLWKPMTRAVQHVGVPGYQWQASVLWDGSLFFGPQLWREHSAVSQEVEALGENLLDVSVGFGAQMGFLDRRGLGNPQIRQIDRGHADPQVETLGDRE